MASFEWERRSSANFGEVWVPAATVQLLTARGSYSSVLAYVDSGSVVSLLRRSVAEELGLRFDAGRRISLNNVGGAQTEAVVHDLTFRFSADEGPRRAPFAIAATESVPNLIGRLGVFDRFEITFDPTRRETRIELPPD